MKYQLKIDLWILGVVLVPLIAAIVWIFLTTSTTIIIILFVIIVLLLTIMWGFVFSDYELKEDRLIRRFLFCKKTIQYDHIKSVRIIKGLIFSTPISTERIEVQEYNEGNARGKTYLCPQNREQFFEELIKNCTKLEEANSPEKASL